MWRTAATHWLAESLVEGFARQSLAERFILYLRLELKANAQ